ncbi:MAG: hypothetical protein H6Q10_2289 [Acidobacteria bacterium]|nr:hypothetical protein [Acidobacteriota bacterium]
MLPVPTRLYRAMRPMNSVMSEMRSITESKKAPNAVAIFSSDATLPSM